MKKFLLVLVAFYFSSISFAEETKLPFSGSFDTSLNTNSLNNPNNEQSLDQDFSLTLFKMFDKDRLLLESSVNKNWKEEQKWTLNDPTLAYTHFLYDHELYSLSFSESLLFGISEEARKNTTLVTSLRLSPSISIKEKVFGITGLKTSYNIGLRKNFHQNETAASSRSNFEWILSNRLTLNYSFLEKYYVQTYVNYQRSRTYQGTKRDRVDHAQSLGMSFTDSLSGEIGHSYGASPLTPDGKDYRVNFYDPRYSTVYISFGISF